MKICYVITTMGHGRGGHFHSLKATAQAMQAFADVCVVNMGVADSPTLCELPDYHFIPFGGTDFLAAFCRLVSYVRREKVDVLHAFDTRAYAFARAVSFFMKIPIVLTKCGGPNPVEFPRVDNLILYSIENENHFRAEEKYRETNMWLIPNRVYEVTSGSSAAKALREKTSADVMFLRIARIGKAYKESILQAMRLVSRLKADGYAAMLAVVGTVEDDAVLKELKEESGPEHVFFCEPEWTTNASRLVSAADFVVGTGRGLMEAAAEGVPILTPQQDAMYPCLITNDNVELLASSNFSPRNCLADYSEEENYAAINILLKDPAALARHRLFVKELYRNKFDIASVISKYRSLYENLKYTFTMHPLDYLRSLYVVNRQYAGARRKMT